MLVSVIISEVRRAILFPQTYFKIETNRIPSYFNLGFLRILNYLK